MPRGIFILSLVIISAPNSSISCNDSNSEWFADFSIPKRQAFTIMCGDGMIDQEPCNNNDTDNDESCLVQCMITVNDEVKFNKSVDWKCSGLDKGLSIDSADNNWNHAAVTVTLDDQDVDVSVDLFDRDFKCEENTQDPIYDTTLDDIRKDSAKLWCSAGNWRLTKEQFENISVSWYHGCKKISEDTPGFKISKGIFESDLTLSKLEVQNISYQLSPRVFHCVVDDKSSLYSTRMESHRICIKRPNDNVNPLIHTSQDSYIVSYGSNLTIVASGHSGEGKSATVIQWFKFNKTSGKPELICDEKNKACDVLFPDNCVPLTEQNINNRIINDFTATFTLKNLTEKDNGLYQVVLITTRQAMVSFTVNVYQLPVYVKWLKIGLIVILGVIILTLAVAFFLRVKYRTDIKYLCKRIFNEEPIKGTDPIAYLVYAADVFENKKNPYKAVRNFLGNRRYYDPVNPATLPENPAGHITVSHTTDMMKRCMTVIFFVTKDIMAEGNRGMEVLEVYRALNENVQSQLPIIFITTRDAQECLCGEKNNNIAFADFMKREKNVVIYWDIKHPNRFRRALYVALPNVVDPSVDDKEQETLV